LMEREGLFTQAPMAPLGAEGERGASRVLGCVRAFAEAASARPASTIVVTEESGLGLVPQGAGARRYLDLAGEALQILAGVAGRVRLVLAGCPMDLKSLPPEQIPPELRLHGDSLAPEGCLDFAVSTVAGGPPDGLAERLASALHHLERYPREQAAIRAIADRHRRCPEEVLPLNGSVEGFWLLAAALRPRHAVCLHPSFTEAEAALRVGGHGVQRVFFGSEGAEDFSLDPGEVPPGADLVVLGNPGNPTGALHPAAMIERLARPGRVLVVDEAFMELVAEESESLASRAELPGLVVLRSITKIWSVPGLRAGYLLGPPGLVAALREARPPWSVNALALVALELCARDRITAARRAEGIAVARGELAARLRALPGVTVWPSSANFLLIRVPDGPRVRAALVKRGIAVRRADTFPGLGEDHLRVSVRTPEENRILIRALEEIMR
ncbi:MAG: Rv2231c family pyridoxal phosphate-dependent protein CobC, partial [Actinomycetota bacterium]